MAQWFSSEPALEGLYGWYRADLIVANDGDPITSWDDQSGLNNTVAKVGAAAINYATNFLNGLPVVRFIVDIGAVCQLSRNTINSTPAGPVFPGGPFTGVTHVLAMRCRANATFPNVTRTLTNFFVSVGELKGDTTGVTTTVWTSDNVLPLTEPIDDWQIVSLRYTNSNGVIDLKTNTQQDSGVSAGVIVGDAMGFVNGSMDVAEGLWYRLPLSDADLSKTRHYLAHKYGIAISV